MIVYDKEQKQIVIPNGLGNVNIVINQGGGECPECPECPDGDCKLGALVAEIRENGEYTFYPSDNGLDGFDIADIRINVQGGEGAVIEDYKWVRPSMGDAAENGDIYIYPDEGYDAVRYINLDPSTIYQEGVEQGRIEGGGGESGGCTLTTRTFKRNGTYRANEEYGMFVIDFSQNGAFDSLLKVSENTTIEFYFAFKEERPGLISFYGCEDADWNDSTFAARYYENSINVKMGSFERSFNVDEYGLNNGEVHKMKVGKNYGISIDDRMLVTVNDIYNYGITFEPSATRTIYIGAINSPDVDGDNGLNLFWRPFYGYIGPVTIVGLNEYSEEVMYNYEPGDFGWWAEYKINETQEVIKNIYTEPGQLMLETILYNSNVDGFSEVTVDLPLNSRNIRVYSKMQTEVADWYGSAGFSEVLVDATDFYNGAADEGRRFVIDSLEELNVSENGTYEAEGVYDVYKETHKYVENTGAFVTDFAPVLTNGVVNEWGFEIEVQAKVNSSEGGEKFIVGCAAERYWENTGIDTNINNVVLKANVDATSLFMSGCKTYNMPTINDEWVTYRITENGLDYKRELAQEWGHLDWEGDTKPRDVWDNKGNDSNIAIGGLNTFYDGLFNEFQGSIRYVRIKQGDYDKVWFPDGGQMRAEGTDDFLDIQDGEAPDFVMDNFKEGSYGWKKVNVNVPSGIENVEKQPISIEDYEALMGNYDPNVIYLIY